MALRERVFGLETEYAINFYPTSGARPDPQTIVGVLQSMLVQRCGINSSPYLVTGAKFHHDVGHAEWAQPECRTAREAAAYDKAADHLLAQVLPSAQGLLNQRGYQGQLLVAKNNVDFDGNTYGCHENYLMLRDSELLIGDYFLRYLARTLIPFLVTRQLFAGAGRLVSTSQTLSYESLSRDHQRAPNF
jgi:proteasome accessory factor A